MLVLHSTAVKHPGLKGVEELYKFALTIIHPHQLQVNQVDIAFAADETKPRYQAT